MVYCNVSCQDSREDLNISQYTDCQFCNDFRNVRYLYLSFSFLSGLSCLLVFLTYALLPRLRHGGYSSRVFIYRTILDFMIALGHIIAALARIQNSLDEGKRYGCIALGAFNVFTLVASNMWYLVLAVDLVKAIRNPFSAAPTYGAVAHTAVWAIATVSTLIPALLEEKGLGVSMFNFCWISISGGLSTFLGLSFAVYYLPHFFIWIFSTVVLVFTFIIFWGGRFAASSETRKFVMKQNVVYVLVLGVETSLIIPLWVIQLGVLHAEGQDFSRNPQFFTDTDFALAVIFAVIHSLRGTIDLLVWWITFSIGLKDFKSVYLRLRACLKPSPGSLELANSTSLHTRLIKADTVVNRALRRDAIYCINVGILDAVKLNVDKQQREQLLGSVREPFVAQAMVLWDEENRKTATEDRLASNPFHHEQTERRITFPPSASIQKFAFQDIEPTVFHLLRDAYSISSSEYRQSFKLKNAADVESSGMLEKFTEGKSGSFFYFSNDFHYIIKTVTSEEEQFLRRISYAYYNHMKQNPNSLIVRFFGLHKVRLAPEQRYISVVVMENIFYNRLQLKMNTIYDLKGSTVGRRALKGGRTRATYHGTLKDLDLSDSIMIGPEAKAQLMEQLEQDVAFLAQSGIMDYSLLLGIHDHSRERPSRFDSTSIELGSAGNSIVDVNVGHGRASYSSLATPPGTLDRRGPLFSLSSSTDELGSPREPHTKWFRQDLGGLRSYSPFHPCTYNRQQMDGHLSSTHITEYKNIQVNDLPIATYYFGVVDILQEYNFRKKVEHLWKTKFLCQNKRELSAVRPQEYGERFLRAMDRNFQ